MSDSELQALQKWLDNREPLIEEFKDFVGRSHQEPWPDFVVIGLAHDHSNGVLKPASKGYPEGSDPIGSGDGPDNRTLVELAARMVSVRSRRWNPDTRTVKPVSREWSRLTREAFPWLPYLEVGDGWSDLIIAMSSMISEVGVPAEYSITQIKSKYGTLRWYDSSDDEIYQIVYAGECLSSACCERCGAPGRQHGIGWISTACDEHA